MAVSCGTDLSIRDRKVVWHPFTQEGLSRPPIPIGHGKGSYVYGEGSEAYLDLISSWWVNLHGHGHPEIVESICAQVRLLEQVIFAGFTHDPAVTLCERLQRILPGSLQRFFFSDNGSTAVEVALKMAYQYWCNRGEGGRNTFMSFAGGYHGDTLGAMSVGKTSPFHRSFGPLLFDTVSLPWPHTWDRDPACADKEEEALRVIRRELETHGERIAALIVEPLVQGAGGMRMCRPEFLQEVMQLMRAYGVLLIFDEVMTGFGRTGTYFAAEQVGIEPDFICLSKGLTGGFLPLALTVTTQGIYEAFLGGDRERAFSHGHSYTANPVACAAAIASFDILVREETRGAIGEIARAQQRGLEILSSAHGDKIQRPRTRGTISAFDLRESIGAKLQHACLERGLLIRPIRDTVYLLPPYSITGGELDRAYRAIGDLLTELS